MANHDRRVKISDIAKAVGVSTSTVSYVLSGQRTISEKTRQTVLRAIQDMGYRPNATARSFSTSKTHVIGFYVQREVASCDLFMSAGIAGICEAITPHGYKLLLLNEIEDNIDDSYVIPVDRTFAMDGAIISNTRNSRQYLSELQKEKIPFVLMGKPPKDIKNEVSFVDNDNQSVAYKATEMLLNSGCNRIALVQEAQDDTTCNIDYYTGYLTAHSDYLKSCLPELSIKIAKDCTDTVALLKEKIDKLGIDGILLISTDSRLRNFCVNQASKPNSLSVICFCFDLYRNFYEKENISGFYAIQSNAKLLGKECGSMLVKMLDEDSDAVHQKMLTPEMKIWKGSEGD